MFKSIHRWLDISYASDRMERRSAPFVQVIMLIMGAYTLVAGYIGVAAGIARPDGPTLPEIVRIADYGCSALSAFVGFWWVRRGHPRQGAKLFLAYFSFSMGTSYVLTGMHAVPVDLLPFLLMAMGGLAIGRKALWSIFFIFFLCAMASIPTDLIREGFTQALWANDLTRGGTILVIYLVVAITLDQTICELRDSIIESDTRGHYLSELSERLQHEIEDRRIAEEKLVHTRRIEAVDDIAAGIAHDFGNILSLIAGYTEQRDYLAATGPEALVEAMERIECAVGRAIRLNERLLDMTRKQTPGAEHFDAAEALRDISPLLKQVFGRRVRFTLDIEDTPLPVYLDRIHLELIALNLAANARDAMREDGRFTIAARREAMWNRIAFRDTGMGMSPQTIEHIFDPFFTTKPPGKGTGLGLTLIRDLLRRAGGSIDVLSVEDAGSEFVIRLPCARSSDAAAETGLIKPLPVAAPPAHSPLA